MNLINRIGSTGIGTQPAPGYEAAFQIIRQLAERAAELLEQDDERASDCLQYVSDTYRSTSSDVLRQAIEVCFVRYISTRISIHADRSVLLNRLPQNLRELVLRQLRTAES